MDNTNLKDLSLEVLNEERLKEIVVEFANYIAKDQLYVRYMNEGKLVFEFCKLLVEYGRIAPNSIIPEFPDRIDVALKDFKIYFELKYVRDIPSDNTIPVTNKIGQLINDMVKLIVKTESDSRKYVLYIFHDKMYRFLKNNHPEFLLNEDETYNSFNYQKFNTQSIRDKIKFGPMESLKKITVVKTVLVNNKISVILYRVN